MKRASERVLFLYFNVKVLPLDEDKTVEIYAKN